MPSASNAASKIATPPAKTSARSSARPGSLRVDEEPCSISASRTTASDSGVMPSSESFIARTTEPIAFAVPDDP